MTLTPIDSTDAFSAIEQLRRLGLSSVAKVLGQEYPPPAHGALEQWLDIDERPTAQRQHGIGEMNNAFPFKTYIPETLFGKTLLSTPVAPRRSDRARDLLQQLWRQKICRERPRLGAVGGEFLADAIVATAFTTPDFRQAVFKHLYRALRDHVLFHPGGPQIESPSPQTILGLVISAGRPIDFAEQPWERLKGYSKEMSLHPGWAGYWDVWLLSEAQSRPVFSLQTGHEEVSGLGMRAIRNLIEVSDHPAFRKGWLENAPAMRSI